MQGLAVANRRVIDELPTVAVGSGILDASADDDDRARARTWARKSARRVTRGLPIVTIVTQRPVGGREGGHQAGTTEEHMHGVRCTRCCKTGGCGDRV